ncbi:MAG: hypothetical protein ACRDRL_29460 [Sciscionella sp.]
MTLSEYIQQLQEIQRTVGGGISVETTGFDGSRVQARFPAVTFTQVLQGRERKPCFWYAGEEEARKGTPVVRV